MLSPDSPILQELHIEKDASMSPNGIAVQEDLGLVRRGLARITSPFRKDVRQVERTRTRRASEVALASSIAAAAALSPVAAVAASAQTAPDPTAAPADTAAQTTADTAAPATDNTAPVADRTPLIQDTTPVTEAAPATSAVPVPAPATNEAPVAANAVPAQDVQPELVVAPLSADAPAADDAGCCAPTSSTSTSTTTTTLLPQECPPEINKYYLDRFNAAKEAFPDLEHDDWVGIAYYDTRHALVQGMEINGQIVKFADNADLDKFLNDLCGLCPPDNWDPPVFPTSTTSTTSTTVVEDTTTTAPTEEINPCPSYEDFVKLHGGYWEALYFAVAQDGGGVPIYYLEDDGQTIKEPRVVHHVDYFFDENLTAEQIVANAQAAFANCEICPPETTTTTTLETTTSTTEVEGTTTTTTTTTTPTSTTVTTTIPGTSTTLTTVVDTTTSTPSTSSTSTTVQPDGTTPTTKAPVVAVSTPPGKPPVVIVASPGPLPRTGSSTGPLVALGAGGVIAGGLLITAGRYRKLQEAHRDAVQAVVDAHEQAHSNTPVEGYAVTKRLADIVRGNAQLGVPSIADDARVTVHTLADQVRGSIAPANGSSIVRTLADQVRANPGMQLA